MNILYVAMQYDYGIRERGYSFEHYNFYDSLREMGHNVQYFDFLQLNAELGRRKLNQRLLETVKSEKPDVMFTVLFNDTLSRKTISEISDSGFTRTVNWFCDDHWRFEDYSSKWAPSFNWVVTTDANSADRYRTELNLTNVIESQWACNSNLYRRLNRPIEFDVTFVGRAHGNRRHIVKTIQEAGIDIQAWGTGWPNGRLNQRQMIEIFNKSRINLNLSNASVVTNSETTAARAGRILRKAAVRLLESSPPGCAISNALKKRRTTPVSDEQVAAAPESSGLLAGKLDQIKGRNFEVPGCGGCILTAATERLDEYYHDGREILSYNGTVGELIEQLRFLLRNQDYCQEVADAGYRRTHGEHTYRNRFQHIFQQMGLCTDMEQTPLSSPQEGSIGRNSCKNRHAA